MFRNQYKLAKCVQLKKTIGGSIAIQITPEPECPRDSGSGDIGNSNFPHRCTRSISRNIFIRTHRVRANSFSFKLNLQNN